MSNEDKIRGQIIFLEGPSDFFLKEKLRAYKKNAEIKYGEFNISYSPFDVPDRGSAEYIDTWTKEIASEIITPSFFGEKRVIFIDNFPPEAKGKTSEEAKKNFMRVLRSAKEIPEGNVLILSSANPDKRTKIYKDFLKIVSLHEHFAEKEGQPLFEWIIARVAKKGGKILPSASRFLAEYSAGDMWKIDNEISKLVAFCEEKPISEKDIELLCIMSEEVADFALSDAINKGNIKKILSVFHSGMESGGIPQTALLRDIAPVIRQILSVLWAIKNNKTAQGIGMNPWLFGKWKNVSSKFSYEKIKNSFSVLALIDEGMKNGKIEISGNDYRMFSLVIETFFIEFFGNTKMDIKKSLYT